MRGEKGPEGITASNEYFLWPLFTFLEQLTKSFDSFKLFAMQTYTANEAKTRFGEFLDRAQRAPVPVLRHDRVVGVMVSAEDYEAMRAFYADRLRHTMDEAAAAAANAGLTQATLDALLADES